MVVLALVRFHPHGTVMQAHFAQHSAVKKRAHVLVHRGQRYGRNFLAHGFVNQLRAGMTVHGRHRFVDDPSLVRGRKLVFAAQSGEL